MGDDEADDPGPIENKLLEALFRGDAQAAGLALQERNSLSLDEIELLAELFLGDTEAEPICSHRLAFVRWRQGRPLKDPLVERARSEARARWIDRLVKDGTKVTAALQIVHEQTGVAITTLKADRRRRKKREEAQVKKSGELPDPESE